MRISTIQTTNKQVMQVYAARAYDLKNPRLTNYVEVNLPEYVPTIPRDNKYETLGISHSFTLNKNFPINDTTVKLAHCISLPLLRGTTCPIYFKKDTPFLLFTPNEQLEDGYLLYI